MHFKIVFFYLNYMKTFQLEFVKISFYNSFVDNLLKFN